ncbi:hypothetical protein AB1Y20_018170 [Prymnesium parvum]|uniref:Uncharacterized protein n=1 Tax=Prymnesium parvum TaxID=97485 RepID=A0AB34JN93_PRYPA
MKTTALLSCLFLGGSALSQNAFARPTISTLSPRPALLTASPSLVLTRLAHPPRMFKEPPPPPDDGTPDEAFEKIIAELTETQRRLKGLGPLAMSATSSSLTVLAALVAWFVTPPLGRVGTLLTVGAGGAAGREAGNKLKEARRKALPAAVAELIQKTGLRELKPAQVAALGQRFGFQPEEVEGQVGVLYARYLEAAVNQDDASPSEISSLAALRRGLGLGWNTTEALHVQRGAAIDAGSAEERQKLLWLSLGLFATSKGKANAAALYEALDIDEQTAQKLVNELSTPIYKKAVAQAVSKYNRTETPEVLQTVRRALSMSDGAAQAVHNAMYDAQLQMLLPDDSAKLTDEATKILGELEGILQIRSAVRRLQARTVPLYRDAARASLEEVFRSDAAVAASTVWGRLALRQQELKLPTETARAALVEEARQIASQELRSAAELAASGQSDAAGEMVRNVVRYGDFVGRMLELSGWGGGAPAADLAEEYLGALSLAPEMDDQASELSDLAGKGGSSLLRAMLALSAPGLDEAKATFRKELDEVFGGARSDNLNARARKLGLSPALQQKLALEAYYGWLSDLSENVDRAALERCEEMRASLGLQDSSVGELYTNTAIDELVLEACLEQLFDGEVPPSTEAQQWILMLERMMIARPGVATSLLEA